MFSFSRVDLSLPQGIGYPLSVDSPEPLNATLSTPSLSRGLDFSQTGLFWEPFSPEETVDQRIEKLLSILGDEEILGQVFLLGWDSEYAEGPVVEWIGTRNIGGVKIFGWNGRNIARTAQTLGELQTYALGTRGGIPLLTSTDQEGGWVRHVKDTTSITPGNMALGAGAIPRDAFLSGYFIGQELRAIGINMNLAPTVDVYMNPEAHVIGPRSFSSDANLTALLGLSFYQGHEKVRVISTAKHFPGHGNATGDSHGEMPVVLDTWKELEERDLVPFKLLIDEGIPAVLTGHLSFPEITGDNKPASLSEVFKTEILRGSLGFEGIAVTDDLFMEGAWEYGADKNWTIAEITLESLRAGNDLVMLSQTPGLNDRVWTLALERYRSDPNLRNSIQNSFRRILRIKYRYLFPEDRVPLRPDPTKVYDLVPAPGSKEFFAEQAARAVHIISGDNLPLTDWQPGSTLLLGQDPDFFRVGRQYFPGAREYQFPYNPPLSASATVLKDVPLIASQYETVVFNLANGNSADVLAALENLPRAPERIFVLSILTPSYLEKIPWVINALAVYGWGSDSFNAGFAALTGRIPATGSNPIPHVLRDR
ncbi:MAG: glycoside hydrolase family 3 protein [Spirochaetales bacterium]|nr:glycoside hydrolase family 3 protein [Spirochaetales bacterium]